MQCDGYRHVTDEAQGRLIDRAFDQKSSRSSGRCPISKLTLNFAGLRGLLNVLFMARQLGDGASRVYTVMSSHLAQACLAMSRSDLHMAAVAGFVLRLDTCLRTLMTSDQLPCLAIATCPMPRLSHADSHHTAFLDGGCIGLVANDHARVFGIPVGEGERDVTSLQVRREVLDRVCWQVRRVC